MWPFSNIVVRNLSRIFLLYLSIFYVFKAAYCRLFYGAGNPGVKPICAKDRKSLIISFEYLYLLPQHQFAYYNHNFL
jgi:hypothetical protein